MHNERFVVSTHGFADILDLTEKVQRVVTASNASSGLVNVFVPGSTAGVTTVEYESGALEDLKHAFERVAPQNDDYEHNKRWGDGNGFSHVRAAMLGPSLTVPFEQKKLLHGTWQQIVLVDFDNHPRKREVVVSVLGTASKGGATS
jgi:secondary thiamine-phosphate synthase enzyme